MQRQDFLAGPWLLMGTVLVPTVSVAGEASADDAEVVKQTIKDVYSAFSVEQNKQKYRSLLTEDYLLLENGEILDLEGDLALMPKPDSGYKRTDSFDFRSVKIQDNIAWVVYFLNAEIKDNKNGTQHKKWLESAILRRSGTDWKISLLHSTKIVKLAK